MEPAAGQADQILKLRNALPFWLSLGMVPLIWLGVVQGGLWVAVMPFYTWGMFSLLDALTGLNLENADPATPETRLFWYRLITLIWVPIQLTALFGGIWYVTHMGHLSGLETVVLFFGMGVMSGTIGINYSHELMHQQPRIERWLADILLASVLYSHFRSEHLRVHHLYVGTPRDPVTARYNEGFHRFFARVLRQCPASAWRAERAMLARAGRPVWHPSNPFWRYGALQVVMLALALVLGGWLGLLLFLWQALVAIWQLELVNYIEHYGLTRRHQGQGRYEHVLPRHSWNAAHRASNWLLINLQRHSDHHYKPDRRFPLLQTYPPEEAPQLPFGYPAMTALAMIPPLWRRRMNPRVRAWRRSYYPEVSDWTPYNKGTNPMPRGAS
ncbi:alkane 1-monooxygenase [Defluviimonas sp. 20V17]|uniref:Alkane 1-monooxygenase n=1 Tax=Allgaiera indica TaxID=765699 RepID=A0AAN4UQX2_9RHOB|nr:alkane 1-monooxygenase [Allgaiera indica]KDB02559.1 alkane 1-monooxygenase [Defluviimonas sp. 20V17]GHE01650.1 alkane 1-monooxygenase [Allgaiera indica]SDW97351.1 alkane 1-monooxygenase [Allgaiera indica]